jgi:hypothetical protein
MPKKMPLIPKNDLKKVLAILKRYSHYSYFVSLKSAND